MMLQIDDVLDRAAVERFRRELAEARWLDGRGTAGYQSALAKHNLQVDENDPVARRLGDEIVAGLERNLLFQSAALPAEIFPPLFNLYREGHGFGAHVDNALRPHPRAARRLRTDVSATLFLSDPTSYEGGDLVVEDVFGSQTVKLPAGSLVLYPATSLHSVSPVTRGTRLAAFFWVQSLIADDARRSLLFDLDMSIQTLRQSVPDDAPALITLTGCYHNLLRMWADGQIGTG